MPSAFTLLRCVGKAVVKNVVNLFTFGVGGDILVDAWDYWQAASREEQRADDVQALAAAPAAEIAAAAAEIVRQEGANLSYAEKQAVADYLQQVAPMIRRSQRRPADPSGTSVRPGATFRRSDDLLPLLPPQVPRFKPGDRPLPGVDWELVELLGRGGFGEVWKAKNPHFDGVEPVALKFCLDPAAKQRLLRHEAAVLNQVMRQGRHDGIVPLLHTYLSADPPCLAYEYVAGGDLAGWIQETAPSGGMPPPQAARIVKQLAEIIGFAHGLNPPIVHRDLKPANILVQVRPGGKMTLKVGDFGIGGLAVQQAREASRRPTAAAFFTSAVLGSYTLLYASPQQMRGDDPHPCDDVYALGVIWYQLLNGDVTKGCPTGRGWQKRLTDRGMSAALVDLLIDCFGDEREERPANGAVLAERLRTLLAETTPPAPPPPTSAPKPQPLAEDAKPGEVNTIRIPGPANTEMKFAWCPAGTFLMGGNGVGDGPQHGVNISKGFWMGLYPVTQAQWQAVMGFNPSNFRGDDRPVEMVSWDDCQEFCQKMTELTGKPIRLPTEAEWEYACRAGTTSDYFNGNGEDALKKVGWYCDNSGNQTHAVGEKAANPWGLHDVHGNVLEWCQDLCADLRVKTINDPKNPNSGGGRALRGGSWINSPECSRAAFHFGYAPGSRIFFFGLRVCFRPDGGTNRQDVNNAKSLSTRDKITTG